MRLRVLFSLGAALPISPSDGEAVFNYRASVDGAHFLGKLFRTLNQVINGEPDNREPKSRQGNGSAAPSVKVRTRSLRRQSKMSKGKNIMYIQLSSMSRPASICKCRKTNRFAVTYVCEYFLKKFEHHLLYFI